MIDVLRLLIVMEVIGAASLPLAIWFFRSLPDRGFALCKSLGLVAVVFVTWLVGSFVPIAGPPWFPIGVLVIMASLGWGIGFKATVASLRAIQKIIVVEEVIFIGGLIAWSLLRAYVMHPDIAHTEQYMDMALLNGSLRGASFPPTDPWMSGHGVNYYYFGYLIFGTVIKVAGIQPAVGYNVALSLIGALTIAGAFSIGFALTRRVRWALLAPLFVELLGNWHAAVMQLTHGHLASDPAGNWIWESTRVVGSAADYTINEFPLFSLVLGDLHPHLMSLPFVLLAAGVSVAILFDDVAPHFTRDARTWGRPLIIAVILGSLFTLNSWDFPTYGLLIFMAVFSRAYSLDGTTDWWKRPLQTVVAVGFASVVLYGPFYLHFKSLAHGAGIVNTRTDLTQFLQVFGYPLLLCLLLVASLAALLRPVDEDEGDIWETTSSPSLRLAERGGLRSSTMLVLGAGMACLAMAIAFHLEVFVLCLILGIGAMTVLQRVLSTEEPNKGDAVALCLVAVGCLVLALTEVVYLKDSFDGSMMYRMNTVFKFYYQAWVLLMLAGAYGTYRAFGIIRRHVSMRWALGALALVAAGSVGGLIDTVNGPAASFAAGSSIDSLDGMAWMQTSHADDRSAIQWLRLHGRDHAVVLEAESEKSGYNPDYARVSVFSGLPTVMGWPDHERQWRINDATIGRRSADVNRIYTTSDVGTAMRLMRRYDVRYVFVGDTERRDYGRNPASLAKFGRFMKLIFSSGASRIYTW